MLKKLLQDTATYGLVSLGNRLMVLLLFPVYARTLAPEELGALDLVSSVGAVLVLLITVDIVSAHARFAADCPGGGPERDTVDATAWAGLLLVLLPATVLLWLCGDALLAWVGLGRLSGTLAAPALVLWVALVVQYMAQNHLRWASRKAEFAAVSLLQGALTLGLGLWLVAVQGRGVHGALVATATGVVSSAALGLWFLRGTTGTRPDWQLWRRMMAFCLPVAGGNLLLVAAQNADRFLLARLAGLDEVAAWGIALRFGLVASLVAGSAQMAIGPLIYDNQSSPQLAPILRQATTLYALLGAALVGVFSCFAPEWVELLASHRYAGSAGLVGMATASALLYGANMLFPGLWLARKTRLIGACYGLYAAMLVALPALGLLAGGIAGLAAGVLLANLAYVVLVAVLSGRALPVGIDRPAVVMAAAATVIGIAVAVWPPAGIVRAGVFAAMMAALAITTWRRMGTLVLTPGKASSPMQQPAP